MEKIIGQIRNILRKEGITGMDSINHCIAFLVCRLLDEDLCNKVGISTTFTFDNPPASGVAYGFTMEVTLNFWFRVVVA